MRATWSPRAFRRASGIGAIPDLPMPSPGSSESTRLTFASLARFRTTEVASRFANPPKLISPLVRSAGIDCSPGRGSQRAAAVPSSPFAMSLSDSGFSKPDARVKSRRSAFRFLENRFGTIDSRTSSQNETKSSNGAVEGLPIDWTSRLARGLQCALEGREEPCALPFEER